MALALQAALLVRDAPNSISEPFCTSRLVTNTGHHYGQLPRGADTGAIIARADPHIVA
jgi:putative acyl-CoA dehydrogenase